MISVEELLAYLNSYGIAVEEGPVKRTDACGEVPSVYIRDPDLNLIEISVYINKPLSP